MDVSPDQVVTCCTAVSDSHFLSSDANVITSNITLKTEALNVFVLFLLFCHHCAFFLRKPVVMGVSSKFQHTGWFWLSGLYKAHQAVFVILLENFHYETAYWLLFTGCLSLEPEVCPGMHTHTHKVRKTCRHSGNKSWQIPCESVFLQCRHKNCPLILLMPVFHVSSTVDSLPLV